MEARTRPIDSAISFALLVFRFFPQRRRRRRSPEAARSCDTRWVSLHGPNSISCGLLIFFPSSPPFSLPSFFSAMELRERGGGEGKEGWPRGNILWRVRGNRIANSCRDSFLASEQLRPSSFVRCSRNILTRLRFDVCTRVHRVNRSAGEGREKKKKKEMEGKETEGWTKCRGKNSNGLPSGIIWDVTMRSREQKLESRG